jgi:hypothetical protein
LVVRTQSNGRGTTGLYIGTRNAKRYFKPQAPGVDLQLGHIHIHCALPPEFWNGRPEIFDSRLSAWLESKVYHARSGGRPPVPMLMIPAEKNSFKLQPMKLPSAATSQGAKPTAAATEAWHIKAKAVADRMHAGHGAAPPSAKKPLSH